MHSSRASGDTLEIKARFRARDADKFGLNVRVGNGEKTIIGYDVTRGGIYLDRTRSGKVDFSSTFPSNEFALLKPDANGDIRLHVYVDRSSVEVFANDGRVAITDPIHRPGHYFPALLVVSRRDPVDSSPFARMQNIARTLVIVEP